MLRTWAENKGIIAAPAVAMALAGIAGTAIALFALYRVTFDAEAARLSSIVQSQARMIEEMVRFNAGQNKDYPEGAKAAAIAQIVAAHHSRRSFGKTGLFAAAERIEDQIVSIFPSIGGGAPRRIAWNSRLAEPMRRALSGKSGTMIGADYRGETVLAAYEALPGLGLGVVAKIDMAEVRAPFIRAGFYALAMTLLFVLIAALASLMIAGPLLRELTRSRREAIEAAQAKSQFLATMSHELRTPLNAIIGFADMMRLQVLGRLRPGLYDAYIDGIHASGQRLLFLVTDILEMAKIESGKYALCKEWIDAGEIMAEAARTVKWRIDDGGLDLALDVCPGIPKVMADRKAVKLALVSLLHNAAKFTPRGGAIVMKAEVIAKTISISVSDTGAGIRPEDKERVFKPFIQAERERNRFHEGAGLGLALALALAEMHGGALLLASEFGKGTTITMALPFGETQPEAAATKARKKASKPSIAWVPAMSVGIKKWDDDHRVLLGLINDLRAADEALVFDLAGNLAAFAGQHLKSEEEAMKALSYPCLGLHQEKHDEFRRWFEGVRKARNDPLACQHPGEMADYLHNWLCSHILNDDMGYKAFFAANRQKVQKALRKYRSIAVFRVKGIKENRSAIL